MASIWRGWMLASSAALVSVACSEGVPGRGGSMGMLDGGLSGATATATGGDDDGDDGVDTEPGATSSVDGSDTGGPTSDTDDPTDPTDSTGDTGPGDPCGAAVCDPNATCDGGVCTCDPGFEGDGFSCADIDGCAAANCFAGVACTDVPAPGDGFECGDCPAGYTGDGVDCADIDGCAPNPCFAGVSCSDLPPPDEGASCGACPAGYAGDGFSCSDIDGCAPNPCYAGVVCTDTPAPGTGFSCGPCPAGLYGDGISCLAATQYTLGDMSNSATLGPYFRANGYMATTDGTLAQFDVYLGLAAACNLDFYVYSSPVAGGALTQLWRTTIAAGAGTSYRSSGLIDIPITAGTYYALGIGWNCAATYYWNNAGAYTGFDAGVGNFTNSRWDNAYPGPSDFYVPPNTGTGTTTYAHHVYFAGP